MEEFLLGLLLAGNKLHVIHQEEVRLAVFFPHFCGFAGAGLDGGHQLVGQIVALDVGNAGVVVISADNVCNGIDQVCLAQAGVAVDQKGVVVLGGVVGNGLGGGIGQLVAGAHHKGLKGKFVGGEAVALPLLSADEAHIRGVVQDGHFKIRGENILEGGLYILHEKGLDIALLEVVGTV